MPSERHLRECLRRLRVNPASSLGQFALMRLGRGAALKDIAKDAKCSIDQAKRLNTQLLIALRAESAMKAMAAFNRALVRTVLDDTDRPPRSR